MPRSATCSMLVLILMRPMNIVSPSSRISSCLSGRRQQIGIPPVRHSVLQQHKPSVRLLRFGADKHDSLNAEVHSNLRRNVNWYCPLIIPIGHRTTASSTLGGRMYDADMVRVLLEEGADLYWRYPNGKPRHCAGSKYPVLFDVRPESSDAL